MGRIAHQKNQFKSRDTYTISLSWLGDNMHYLIFESWLVLMCKPWIYFTQGCFVPSLVELAQWYWRRRFLNFINIFSLFCNYLPFWKEHGPSFEQTWMPTIHINPVSWWRFSKDLMYFLYFPWKRVWQCFFLVSLFKIGPIMPYSGSSSLQLRWAKNHISIGIIMKKCVTCKM